MKYRWEKKCLLGMADIFLAETEKGLGSGGPSSGLGVPFIVTHAGKTV